jgi:hypothetical protein
MKTGDLVRHRNLPYRYGIIQMVRSNIIVYIGLGCDFQSL